MTARAQVQRRKRIAGMEKEVEENIVEGMLPVDVLDLFKETLVITMPSLLLLSSSSLKSLVL